MCAFLGVFRGTHVELRRPKTLDASLYHLLLHVVPGTCALSPSPPLSLSPSGRYRGAAPSKRPPRRARRVVGCAVQHPRAPASARRLNKEALSTRSRRLYTSTRALSAFFWLQDTSCDVSAQEQSASKALRPYSGAGQCAREGPQAHAQAVAHWEQGRTCTSDAAAASHAGRAFCSSTGEAGRGAAPRTLQRHGRSQLLSAAVAATVAVGAAGVEPTVVVVAPLAIPRGPRAPLIRLHRLVPSSLRHGAPLPPGTHL